MGPSPALGDDRSVPPGNPWTESLRRESDGNAKLEVSMSFESIIIVVVIVLIVLFVLGFIGRGRMGR
jgi:hypothetical protein